MGIRKIIREELEDWEWAMDDKITMDDLEVGDIVEIKNLTTWWYSTINDCAALEYFNDVEEGDRFKVISKDENIPFEDISCCYENPECQKSVTGVGLEAMDGTREEIWVSDDLLTVDIVEPSPSRGIVRESEDGWTWAEQPLVTPFDKLGEGDIVTIYKIKGDYLDVALRNCD
jgi:hypothetical protein